MIRIFVGCAENNADLEAQAALEWSIRKNTAREVSITWMNDWTDWNRDRWTTPFSAGRWQVPALCDFAGKAIYCDSDFLFLADIGELWDQPIHPSKTVIAKGKEHGQRLCCCVWDCSFAHEFLPPIDELKRDARQHRRLMEWFSRHQELVQPFDGGDWNCLDLEAFDLNAPTTKAVHYTGIPTQPHLKYALPRLAAEGKKHWYRGPRREHPRRELQALFDRYLAEAIEAGYTPDRYRTGG
jgi:hypothetical protein